MRLNLSIWPAVIGATVILGGSIATQYDWSLERFEHEDIPPAPAVQAPTDSVVQADTIAAFPGCKGPGCLAFNEVRDSILFGGDGIRGNSDDWGSDSVRVWKVTHCADGESGGDRDPFADSSRWSVTDSVENYPTSFNIVLDLRDSACRDTSTTRTLKNTYWAGQTSRNEEGATSVGGWFVLDDGSADVVIRYMKGRAMYSHGIAVWDAERVVIDHAEVSWSPSAGGQANLKSGSASAGDSTRHISFTWSLAFEPRIDQNTNWSVGGSNRDAPWQAISSVYRSAVLGKGHRTPNMNSDTVLLAKHIVYNAVNRHSSLHDQFSVDAYGYFVILGPSRQEGNGRDLGLFVGEGCQNTFTEGDSICTQNLYANNFGKIDNYGTTDTIWNQTNPANMWRGADSMITCRVIPSAGGGEPDPDWQCPSNGDTIDIRLRVGETGSTRSAVFTPADFGIPSYMWPDTTGYSDTTELIAQLDSVGFQHRLKCDGTWVAARDTVTRDIVNRALNELRGLTPVGAAGGDTLDNVGFDLQFFGASVAADLADTVTLRPNDPGSYLYVGPDTLGVLPRCTDTDNDGMPATWEAANGLSDSDATDVAGDPDFDGYLNIEEYLNGTDPQVFTSADDGSEDVPLWGVTYHDSIALVTDTLIDDTLIFSPTDTMFYKTWRDDSIPYAGGHTGWYCVKSDQSRVIYITKDTLLPSALPLDSAIADSILADWNVPGCDTASVKSTTIP